MCINDLEINKEAKIVEINCDDILRNRLYSFGVIKDEKLVVTAKSIAKKTLEIKINQSKIALRSSEASKIKVEVC
ncbi:FeoA domain protein [Aliarcobacter thereius]|uniref:Ferrous iron transport protein A n=1 Tax=Aliarcobacter thereius TaxID=544718 RepID=A0A5R9H5A6_9BACT|nr:FeoA domain-containing protein [Aliarcobacter thereius]OCL86077.1 FeoA domain protein [Aliarcobacter thereius]TLS71123.1 ferrous iron transport protein A [Aliarcobacter thereius]TLT06727.1 ferrous iron transport protein A [Aliarcobacter thereius]